MAGNLFTDYFLTDGIKATPEWRTSVAVAAQFDAFGDSVRQRYDALTHSQDPNEAVTEQELIRPVLELLGWTDYLPQQGASRNEDIPDLLLFPDADAKERAITKASAEERYRDAVVVEESKRFGLPLDARGRDGRRQATTPHDQIVRYLSTAEVESEGRIRWGVLTNGGVWRLYDYRARPRATGYFEASLGEILESGDTDRLRTFYLLFRRDSFEAQEGATVSFLETALAEGRRYEQQVAQDLSAVVFERAFPRLVQALAEHTQREPAELRGPALILLYRLFFVLYAEDRGLLPVNDSRYEDYGLRKPVRDDIARRMAEGSALSARATNYYDHLTTLSQLIDQGDAAIGLPPYNGGLFNDSAAPLLANVRLPDAAIAPIIYDLSHTETPEGRRFVNYRDMSVQQLGSIYERLLEREPVWDDDGNVVARPNSYARKDSGSFFTPQELVDLIVDRTLKPLAEERLAAFAEKAAELTGDPRPKAERYAELLQLDPAEAVLDLKVLDPAMGSGHFLVTAVDFLSDYIAEMVEHAPGPGVARWRLCIAFGGAGGRNPSGHLPAGPGSGLGDGPGPTHRPGHHPADGAQALHLRSGQEPTDRGAGEGVAVAAQLHRRRAAVLSGPPPALWRLPGRPAGDGSDCGAEPSGRPVRQFGHNRSGSRHGWDGAYRGDVRCRHRGGPAVGHPVPGSGGYYSGPAQPAGPPDRLALADRRYEAAGAQSVRVAAG